jgi:hypothetical protein
MIRLLLPLAIAPTLAGCGLEELFNPGQSQARQEYRASITSPPPPIQKPIQSTESPVQPVSPPEPTTVAEIEPIAVPEPVYVPPPEPKPDCTADLYMIYKCVEGRVVML